MSRPRGRGLLPHGLVFVVPEKENNGKLNKVVGSSLFFSSIWLNLSQFFAEGAIQPTDVLSRQMLDYSAADRALEDAIYALDRGVQEGSVPFDGYLRSVRVLAREQFFQRVLYTKVTREQQQVARMAARAQPQYAS
jgi:hypothetical protein